MNYTISDITVKEEYKHKKNLVDFFEKLKSQKTQSKLLDYILLSLQKKKNELYIKIKRIDQIKQLLIHFDKGEDWEDLFSNGSYSTFEAINSFYELCNELFEFNKTKLVQESTNLKQILNSIKFI